MFRLLERRRERILEQEVPEIPEEFKRIPPEIEEALKKVAGHTLPVSRVVGKGESTSSKIKTF